MTDTISGATLKVTLQGLGIPPSYFADSLGVTMRTVVRWFDGESVPQRAALKAQELRAMTHAEMDKLTKQMMRRKKAVLKTYRTDEDFTSPDDLPASWHRALVFRVLEDASTLGHNVTVEYR